MRAGTLGMAATALALALAGGACTGRPSADTGGLDVVTTVAPITSIVAAVAGERASVTGLVPEGSDSHTFEPPPSVARTLAEADVVFLNGLGLEEQVRRLGEQARRGGSRMVALGEAVLEPSEYVFDASFPAEAGRPNPHLWTSPRLTRRYAQVVADELEHEDPDGSATYRANLADFTADVDELDAAMRTATASLPAERRKLLTYHDAYAYFAREYGWTVVGAIQPADFREPTAREVAALVEQVRSERVPAVFGSEVFPSPALEQIGRETGVRYVDVLRDDDLPGRPGDSEHSWLGLMRFDFVTMVESLGGDASALKALELHRRPERATYPQ